MYYAILAQDVPDSLGKRRQARSEHLARLESLREQGRLFTAGPHPAVDAEDPGDAGFVGSLIIAEFDSLEAAQQWAETDPFIAAGVYMDVQVRPYKKVF